MRSAKVPVILATVLAIAIHGQGQGAPLTVVANIAAYHYCRVQVSSAINLNISIDVKITNSGDRSIQLDAIHDPVAVWFRRTSAELQAGKYEMHFQAEPMAVGHIAENDKIGSVIQPGESVKLTRSLEIPVRGTFLGELPDGDHYMRAVADMLLLYNDQYMSHEAKLGPMLVNISVPANPPPCAITGAALE